LVSSAALVKFLPGLMYLPFFKPRFWQKIVLFFALVVLIVLPFALSGVIPMAGFFSYLNRWSFNGAVFQVGRFIIEFLNFDIINLGWFNLNTHLEQVYINPEFYYKIIAFCVFIIVIITQVKKSSAQTYPYGIQPLVSAFVLTGTFLLLTPTLHPWYVLWIIPFVVFLPRWSWLIFTFLVQLSYQVLKQYQINGIWEEQSWILLIEYVPFYSLLIWEFSYKKKIKGLFN
jgi:hypothetical protein